MQAVMKPALWSVCRLWVRLRRGRVPPTDLPDPAFLDGVEVRE
jgi:hypothetical protein